jgi:hypothetical protein
LPPRPLPRMTPTHRRKDSTRRKAQAGGAVDDDAEIVDFLYDGANSGWRLRNTCDDRHAHRGNGTRRTNGNGSADTRASAGGHLDAALVQDITKIFDRSAAPELPWITTVWALAAAENSKANAEDARLIFRETRMAGT